jgi:hypothetical protein
VWDSEIGNVTGQGFAVTKHNAMAEPSWLAHGLCHRPGSAAALEPSTLWTSPVETREEISAATDTGTRSLLPQASAFRPQANVRVSLQLQADLHRWQRISLTNTVGKLRWVPVSDLRLAAFAHWSLSDPSSLSQGRMSERVQQKPWATAG